jgi:urease accessory protein
LDRLSLNGEHTHRGIIINIAQLAAVLQLASPALPIGAFSYSQGLEAAVNAGVVVDEASAGAWICDQFQQSFLPRELFSLQAAFLSFENLLERGSEEFTEGLNELSQIDQAFVASRDSAEGRIALSLVE